MSILKSVFIIFCCFLLVQCLKEEKKDITVYLIRIYEKNIGRKGTVVLEVDRLDESLDFTDTSKTTYFKANISNNETSYNVDCGFWKANGERLYVFCNVDEKIPSGQYEIDFKQVPKINYKNYIINLVYPPYSTTFEFTKSDKDIIDLYSDKQTIIVEERKDTYDLKFKIVCYEKIYILISSYLPLDCSKENDELKCPISKSQLESILTKKESQIYISYLNYLGQFRGFPLVPRVDVKYDSIQKIDLYIGITKLISNIAEHDTMIAYETNITEISNVITGLSTFSLTFMNTEKASQNSSCCFRKYNNDSPLLIVCFIHNEGKNWLDEISEEKVFNDLNIKYNFRIQPVNNEERLYYKGETGTFIFFLYPEILDFTNSDSLTIDYVMEHPKELTGITFNEDAGDLSCRNIGSIKRCIVPKSHFKGKKEGYYFTKHNNHLDGKTTSYEGTPIKVIYDGSPSEKNQINLGFNLELNLELHLIYSLLLLFIMV